MTKIKSTSQNEINNNKQIKFTPMAFFISFVLISGLVAFIIGGIVIGKSQ